MATATVQQPIDVTPDLAKKASLSAVAAELAAPKANIRTTSGYVYFFSGTQDNEPAYLDFKDGSSNLKRPDEFPIVLEDIRSWEQPPTFAKNGYELTKHKTLMVPDQFINGKTPEGKEFIQNAYFPEVKKITEQVTGAALVVPYIYRLRKQTEKPEFSSHTGSGSLPLAHVDRDNVTGVNGILETFGEEEGNRLMKKYKRFAQVNVWRGIGHPVDRWPLMFIDTDEIPGGFRYETHNGKIFTRNDPRVALRGVKTYDIVIKHDEHYKYRYCSNQQVDEVFVFSSYDSDEDAVAPHSGFWDNATPEDAPPRLSIEARSWCFFDPIDADETP